MEKSTGKPRYTIPLKAATSEGGVVEHPTAEDFAHARALPEDRTWFKARGVL